MRPSHRALVGSIERRAAILASDPSEERLKTLHARLARLLAGHCRGPVESWRTAIAVHEAAEAFRAAGPYLRNGLLQFLVDAQLERAQKRWPLPPGLTTAVERTTSVRGGGLPSKNHS